MSEGRLGGLKVLGRSGNGVIRLLNRDSKLQEGLNFPFLRGSKSMSSSFSRLTCRGAFLGTLYREADPALSSDGMREGGTL